MIRYPMALATIEAEVENEAKGWLARASARTAIFATLGGYAEEYKDAHGVTRKLPPFWGDVKPVFMRHQYNKCVYCETKLEGHQFSTIQWDLEHAVQE